MYDDNNNNNVFNRGRDTHRGDFVRRNFLSTSALSIIHCNLTLKFHVSDLSADMLQFQRARVSTWLHGSRAESGTTIRRT